MIRQMVNPFYVYAHSAYSSLHDLDLTRTTAEMAL